MSDEPQDNMPPSDDEDASADESPSTTEPAGAGGDDVGSMAEDALNSAQAAVDDLLQNGEQEAGAGDAQGGEAEGETGAPRNVDLPSFKQVLADVEAGGISLLHDVDLDVKIELGRTDMLVEDVLKLNDGSVVELDKLAGDPVDVYVNGRLVARGEVLVLNENFCVRISEIVDGEEVPEQHEAAETA